MIRRGIRDSEGGLWRAGEPGSILFGSEFPVLREFVEHKQAVDFPNKLSGS
jgi:hypothetical protein